MYGSMALHRSRVGNMRPESRSYRSRVGNMYRLMALHRSRVGNMLQRPMSYRSRIKNLSQGPRSYRSRVGKIGAGPRSYRSRVGNVYRYSYTALSYRSSCPKRADASDCTSRPYRCVEEMLTLCIDHIGSLSLNYAGLDVFVSEKINPITNI